MSNKIFDAIVTVMIEMSKLKEKLDVWRAKR